MSTDTANTRVLLRYRDGANFKQDCSVVVTGPPRDDLVARFTAALDAGEYLIPQDCGLDDVRPQLAFTGHLNPDDHCWVEVEGLEPTGDAARPMPLTDLVARVEAAAAADWPSQTTDLDDLLDAEWVVYDGDHASTPAGELIA